MAHNGCTGYRFDTFEVQLGTETLLRKGHRVRIQQLPFQMLVALLERSGEPVSRDELRNRLWNEQIFLEFDNNLRVAAGKLREALGDQANEPRFVKTVARKGYQFIGEATPIFDAPILAEASLSEASEEQVIVAPANRSPLHSFWIRQRRLVTLAVLTTVLIACAGIIYWVFERPLALGEAKVTLGGVTNETGDPAFDGALSTAFRFKMQDSPYLNLLQDQDLRRQLKGNDKAPLADDLTACRALGASIFLDALIARRGPHYELEGDAWRCSDGKRVVRVSSTAASQADVLPALDRTVEAMRKRLGEPASVVEKDDAPLTQATTGSLLALKSFSLGNEKLSRGDVTQSIADYRLAIDLDPQFALAHAQLAKAYMNAKRYADAKASAQRAFDLRERTTDRERLSIAAYYYSYVTGELPRQIEAYRLWQTVYPRDVVPVLNLANTYLVLGEPDKALELAVDALHINPNSQVAYGLEARAYLGSGRYAELDQICNDPARRKTDLILFHSTCYLAAFVRGDQGAEQRELQWANGNPQESVMLEYVALGEMFEGRLGAARHTFDLARQSASKNNLVDFVAELDLDESGLEADLGLPGESRPLALDALRLAPNSPLLQAAAALELARSGDVTRAQIEAASAAAQSPLNTIQNGALLTSVHAAVQMREHDPKGAARSLEDARPFDNFSFMELSPAYYRGLAFLEDKRLPDAAAAFQQVIDHRALSPQSLYTELARLQLGRVLELEGDTSRADKEYEVLDRLWAHADAAFPPLKELHGYERQVRR